MSTMQKRRERAWCSLVGLSVGDALGERFFGPPDVVLPRIQARQLPPGPWGYTDDTEMALSVYDCLRRDGHVDQGELARAFARRMTYTRGYGRGAYELLCGIQQGQGWEALSKGLFEGRGSYGNGAAMRVAPLGAFYADDFEHCVSEAKRQAEVTHANPEGEAGAVAVALAAALAARQGESPLDPSAFMAGLAAHTPPSQVRDGILRAQGLGADTPLATLVEELGNGSRISAMDTVPFCIWTAAHYMDCFEEAFWHTVAALGDRDTTCAIVGGIVACHVGIEGIPSEWIARRERLPLSR